MFEHPRKARWSPARLESTGRLEISAIFLLAVLSVVWGWWAWQEGAYFGVVLFPGALLLCLAVAMLAILAPWQASLRFSRPAAIALGALLALAAWTALSALWSPAPDAAVFDGLRVLIYAIAFGLGLWLCNLLGPRMELSLLPVAAAAGFAGVACVIAMLGDDPRSVLEIDGTLDFPLGYRNATAAFFAIAIFPAVGLAAKRDLDVRARGAALGVATLCSTLFLLCQSRGAIPALAVGVLAFIMLAPQRLRAVSWLALAALPALMVIPSMNDLFAAANADGVAAVADQMHTAARNTVFIAFFAALLGGLAAHNERSLPGLGARTGRANRTVGRAVIGLIIAAVAAFVVVVGDPVDWLGERASEFREADSPSFAENTSRFQFNAGSERYDLWRVALDEFADDPLFGSGAGGFQYAYLQQRDTEFQNARDAHGVGFEHLAELGVPGFALIITALVAAVVGAMHARRLGPSAAALTAAALASGAYWIVHAAVDWFWPYPAVTAPVLMLLGAACAPAMLSLEPRPPGQRRLWIIGAVVLTALAMLPPFLSERYVNKAYEEWREEPERAYSDLDAAQALNPLADLPILAEGTIARALGDDARAVAAFRDAVEKRPEEWASHYLLAEALARADPLLARNEARVALELNPLSKRAQALARRLGVVGPR